MGSVNPDHFAPTAVRWMSVEWNQDTRRPRRWARGSRDGSQESQPENDMGPRSASLL